MKLKDRTGKKLTSSEIMHKASSRSFAILSELGILIVHVAGLIPSHHMRRFMYRIAGMRIGKGSTIHMMATFQNPANISIGEDSIVGEKAFLDGRGKLSIGNHVAIASEVMIYNAEHDINHDHFVPVIEEVIIDDYVFIGPRAVLLPGIRIGKGAVIAAGAVVTKDVPPMTLVGGVPAKPIAQRKISEPSYRIGRASWFR